MPQVSDEVDVGEEVVRVAHELLRDQRVHLEEELGLVVGREQGGSPSLPQEALVSTEKWVIPAAWATS